MNDAFAAAAEALASADAGASLCGPIVGALSITGAAISTMGGLLTPENVCASDRHAARLDEAQLDLGEGPCWDAIKARTSIYEPDLDRGGSSRWPAFHDAIREEPVRAIFAFPLMVGPLNIGALDLYSANPGELPRPRARDAAALADIAARQVLRRALAGVAGEGAESDSSSRAVVHQATGMVLAQLDISATDALLVLKGRAYSSGRTLREIALDVVERRLDFSGEGDGSDG